MVNATVGAWATSGANIAILKCAPTALIPATRVERSAAKSAGCGVVRAAGNVARFSVRDALTISIGADRVQNLTASAAKCLKRVWCAKN